MNDFLNSAADEASLCYMQKSSADAFLHGAAWAFNRKHDEADDLRRERDALAGRDRMKVQLEGLMFDAFGEPRTVHLRALNEDA